MVNVMYGKRICKVYFHLSSPLHSTSLSADCLTQPLLACPAGGQTGAVSCLPASSRNLISKVAAIGLGRRLLCSQQERSRSLLRTASILPPCQSECVPSSRAAG